MRDALEISTTTKTSEIQEKREGEPVIIGGLLSSCRKITTKRNDLMMVCNIEDFSGSVAVVVFPRSYEKYSGLLSDDNIVIVKGKVNRDMRTEEFNVVADIIEPLTEVRTTRTVHIDIREADNELLASLKEVLVMHPGDEMVYIHFDDSTVAVGREYSVRINPTLISNIETLVGGGSARVEFEPVVEEKQGVAF